jgi:inner membrane protein
MDVGTHALASLFLTRALVPRAPLAAWILVAVAGTVADVDALSARFGPSAYLDWHHTRTHSIVVSAAIGLVLGFLYLGIRRQGPPAKMSAKAFLSAVLLSGFLHLAMDVCTADGITPFWPFRGHRFAASWLASVDPWIIAILIVAILLPELSRLVSDEIGAKAKGPRGQVGAILGLIFILIYVGVRANFHSSALAAIQARTYRGESPRRSNAYAESVSPFAWHAIVETDHALQELTIDVTPGASFDPENGTTLFKPEPSPVLESAQNTDAAKRFLQSASFPKASMEKTPEGHEVQIRDLRYAVSGQTRNEVVAVIRTDSNGRVTQDELRWAQDFRRR